MFLSLLRTRRLYVKAVMQSLLISQAYLQSFAWPPLSTREKICWKKINKLQWKCRIYQNFQPVLSISILSLQSWQYYFWARTSMYFLYSSDWVSNFVVWIALLHIYSGQPHRSNSNLIESKNIAKRICKVWFNYSRNFPHRCVNQLCGIRKLLSKAKQS